MNRKQNTNKPSRLWLLIGAGAILAAVLLVLFLRSGTALHTPDTQPTESTPAEEETMPHAGTTAPAPVQYPADLGNGLLIEWIDRYAGIYMEDGTNDAVQDVMMILVRNTSDQDLQLARIQIHYPEFTAEFELTNLPAGGRVVALERSRHSAVSEPCRSIEVQNVVFFRQPMDLMSDQLELGGKAGIVHATNISDEDLAGPVYLYYKNSAEDLYYGGITYRVTITQGIRAGETVQIPAGHYDPQNCSFVMAACSG